MKGLLVMILLLGLCCCHGLGSESPAMLRYDDGVPEDGMWINSNRGHAVLFTPPAANWTLSQIAVCGRLNPDSDQNLIVFEIWDENLNLLYGRADNPGSYFGDEMAWAEIDVPDISLSSEFFVCIFEFSSVYVGFDLKNASSGRSVVVSRSPNRIDTWNLPYPRNGTDWSMVAAGVSAAPSVDLFLRSKGDALIMEAMISDPDGDLARASMQVVDNETLDVLWSEQRLIEGSEANLSFIWPLEMLQVRNGTTTLKPIFSFNTVGVSPDMETYMHYLAPCILKISSEGKPIDAAAYFGEDGEFHALIDMDGFTHYASREFLEVVQPQESYGDYLNNNVTLKEGLSALNFFSLNLDKGMQAFRPLLLTRSPVNHYKLSLDEVKVSPGEYIIEFYAEDLSGNKRKATERISI